MLGDGGCNNFMVTYLQLKLWHHVYKSVALLLWHDTSHAIKCW